MTLRKESQRVRRPGGSVHVTGGRHKPETGAKARKIARALPDPTPVRAQLAGTLRRLITDGHYRAGDRMTERELCDRLGVSRPSIREAMRQLEAEGLVDIVPNRGPVVKVIGVQEVLELWEIRIALETLVASRFALHGTPEQIDELEKAIGDFDAALRSEDTIFIKSAKTSLFEALAAGANNPVLASYCRQVNARLSFLWSSSLMFPGRPAESISELSALLAAIKGRNAAAAEAAMLLHVERGKAIGMYGLRVFEQSRRISPSGRGGQGVSQEKQ